MGYEVEGEVESEVGTWKLTRSIRNITGSLPFQFQVRLLGPAVVHPTALLGVRIWKAQATAANERRAKRQCMVRGIIKKREDGLVDEDERSF